MDSLKDNKMTFILLSLLFGLLAVVGLNPTTAFADEIKTIPVATPYIMNPNDIYRDSDKNPQIRITVYDVDTVDSVGGDIYIYNEKNEIVAQDTYKKNTASTYNKYHYLDIPLKEMVVGKQLFRAQIISRNADMTKKGESIPKDINIETKQKYTIKHVDKFTNEEIKVTNANMPKEYINAVGTNINNVVLGLVNVSDTVNKKNYKYDRATIGNSDLERTDNNVTYLRFKHTLNANPNGEEITIYYVSDVPDFFYERSQKIEEDFDVSQTMPIINRELVKDTSTNVNQRITLGPIDKNSGLPFPTNTILGNGTYNNTGNFYLNVMDEFTNGDFSTSTTSSYAYNAKTSGLAIYRPSIGATSTEVIYLDPNYTKYFYRKLPSGEERIKVLSLVKPTPNNTNPAERFIVEYTIVVSPETNEIDMTIEVTNGTGQDQDLAIMYTTTINTVGAISGTVSTTNGPIQSLGDNKGISIVQSGRDIRYDIENTVLFPDKANNGPSNWIVGGPNLMNNFIGFNRGGPINTVNGEGFETGYTLAESTAAGDSTLVGKPYKAGHSFNVPTTLSALRMKTDVKQTKANESVKLNWKVRFGETKLKKDETSIYREMDKQSGENLEKYDLVSKVIPIEIDSQRVADETDVRNFMVFGGQSPSLDTLSSITGSERKNNNGSKINIDYRSNQVGLMFPRVITYNKNYNLGPTSYSYYYQTNADDPVYGGSGFGLATFQNNLVENTVANDLVNASQIDEYYVSEDGKSAKAYGMYSFGTGEKIPIKITLESANDKGKARMILEYMNTLDHQTNFNSFYTVHMDINNQHKTSAMKTLGGTKGIYFEESNLSLLKGSKYYVAFYTHNSNNGVPVDNMNVYNLDSTNTTFPLNWYKANGSETANVPRFNPSQTKGEQLKNRDSVTGDILATYPAHPGWFFTYASQELQKNEIGRADIELKVTDLEDIIYSPVTIIPEKDKEAHNKTELTYQPVIEQMMDAKIKSKGHKSDNVRITTTYNPHINTKKEDFKVYVDGVELDENLYTFTLDDQKNEFEVLFKDPVPWDLRDKKVEIKQISNISTEDTTNDIMKYYDKNKQQFTFDITSYNSWEIHDDPTEIREVQDPVTKNQQIVKYKPTITAKAIEGLSVNSGDTPEEANKYIKELNQPDFAFDKFEVTFKDNKPPVFKGNGNVTFIVVVKSKEFGNSIEIPVTVAVSEDVNMTVKRFVQTPNGTTEQLIDLNDPDLKNIKDITKKVKVTEDFSKIIKGYEDEEILGYDHNKTIVKVNHIVETDYSKVPNKDFVLELYYSGKVMLDYPESFDFGSHKLSILGNGEIRPKITRDGNSDDSEMKMQVINTQGNGSVWKLSASQTKELKKGTDVFRGKMYYIPSPGSQAIELDNTFKKIEVDSQNKQVINRIPLLPKDLNTKAGIYIDIYPGNKLGNYTNGEITWNLEDAL